ncbi:Protein cortex [Eufriesea mexicana]|nr:Protein cortex [Eufriesea mexicana]
MDAASYLLTKKIKKPLKENELDVFHQVDSLPVKWRKKFMHQLMVQENVIPGVRQKQVLRSSHLSLENKLPGNLAGRPKELLDEEYLEDGMWKSKPRKRPLIGIIDALLDMPGFPKTSRFPQRFIDWGAGNVIAAAIYDRVAFYDTKTDVVEPKNSMKVPDLCALKWNHAGNKLLICTLSSEQNLYCSDTRKIIWSQMCVCTEKYYTSCNVRCACWTKDDRFLITGCTGQIVVYSGSSGRIVNSIEAHNMSLLTIALSSTDRYLASSSFDKSVRIFEWPSLCPYLDITYYEYVVALAWHPFESGLLCIGGGLGDGSLSLWNMNKLKSVNYRHVQFCGVVNNMIWNKLSGELVVQWSYLEGRNQYAVMPVFASLDRIVDVVPIDKEIPLLNSILWNPDHTQLAVQHDESLSMWNFFGDLDQYQRSKKRHKAEEKERTNARFMNFKEFKHFKIR